MPFSLQLLLMLLGAALLLAWAEFWVRKLGFHRFPLFARDGNCRYRMLESQHGYFRLANAWSYDAWGMRSTWTPSSLKLVNILLGDSVVDGGNHISQPHTLAAKLQSMTGQPVYPIACHGWSLANELGALTAYPEWAMAKRLILVLNSGDFDQVNSGDGEVNFPTKYPACFVAWIMRRALYRRATGLRRYFVRHQSGSILEQCRASNLRWFTRVAEEFEGQIVIVRYPFNGRDDSSERYFEELAQSCKPSVPMIDLRAAEDWNSGCYSDHIHPNQHGIEVFARIIQSTVF